MRFISEATQPDGYAVVHALGVTRAQGGLNCELIYVQPTPGEAKEHTPLPAGPIEIQYWAGSDAKPESLTILWPGLTTGVPIGSRVHTNFFIEIAEETYEQDQTEEERG